MSKDRALRALRAELSERSYRITKQRMIIVEELASSPRYVTAKQLHDRLVRRRSGIGLATVYRTLAALSDGGAVDALAHRPGEACYRLCGSGHHHHLVCERCNRVVELAECDLEPWLERLGDAHGFEVTRHSVEVTGICSDCAA